MKTLVGFLFILLTTAQIRAQSNLPIIDMHLHASTADANGPPPMAVCVPFEEMPTWDQTMPYGAFFMQVLKNPSCANPVWGPETDQEIMEKTIEAMDTHKIVLGVLGGSPQRVKQWMDEAPGRFLPGLNFNIDAPNAINPDSLRKLFNDGSVQVFAEITNQYTGTTPDDDRMQPYWALAEELDIPVGIHIGPGPPGVLYLSGSGYRAKLHSPLILEEVLARHPRLRVYIMHAGYPMLDDLLAVLYAHPQVYVDLGVIIYTQPEAAFYRFLRGIVEAGFGKRVLFGSDQMNWPGVIGPSIQRIREAPFLTNEQKRDIMYNNAARFLRLSDEEIQKHHE